MSSGKFLSWAGKKGGVVLPGVAILMTKYGSVKEKATSLNAVCGGLIK